MFSWKLAWHMARSAAFETVLCHFQWSSLSEACTEAFYSFDAEWFCNFHFWCFSFRLHYRSGAINLHFDYFVVFPLAPVSSNRTVPLWSRLVLPLPFCYVYLIVWGCTRDRVYWLVWLVPLHLPISSYATDWPLYLRNGRVHVLSFHPSPLTRQILYLMCRQNRP